jgi:hypothetical protein
LQHTIIQAFHEYVNGEEVPKELKPALQNLSDLYAAHHLWKHVSLLYMGMAAMCPSLILILFQADIARAPISEGVFRKEF